MNYYEHHIGDYLKNTAHLSMVEDAAYRRLIDAYYTRESPLPADRKAVQKLARAQSKDERIAVDYVLDEFFELREDGWHQTRCDAEIDKYREKAPRAQEKRDNAKARQDKARARRRAMFEELASHGVTPPWDTTTADLEALLSLHESQARHTPVTRDSTATQAPDTSHQSPGVNQASESLNRSSATLAPIALAYADPSHEVEPTEVGLIAKRLRSAGIEGVNTHDPRLHALLQAGISADELCGIAEEPKSRGKGMAWVLATAEGRRRDAAKVRPLPRASPSLADRNRQAADEAKRMIFGEG